MEGRANNWTDGGSCPEFPDWPKLRKHFVFAPGLPDALQAAFREAETLLREARPIKVSGSTTAGVVTVGGRDYFIKRGNVPALTDRLRRIGRLSRAERNFAVSERLAALGVRVPEVLMALSTSRFGVPGPSYLVTEFLRPPMTVWHNLGAMLERADLEHWVRRMARLMALLHRHGICHGDLKLVNFLALAAPEEADGFQLGLFDFDGTTLGHRPCSDRVRRKELARAVSSSFFALGALEREGSVTAEELTRLWSTAYCDAAGRKLRNDKVHELVRHFLKRAERREKRSV